MNEGRLPGIAISFLSDRDWAASAGISRPTEEIRRHHLLDSICWNPPFGSRKRTEQQRVLISVSARPMPAGSPAASADARFIESAYAAYIDGQSALTPSVAFAAADGYRRYMAADLAGIGLGDRNGSAPWAWPLARGAIVYRWDSDGVTISYLALAPDLMAWPLSLAGVLGSIIMAIGDRLARRRGRPTDPSGWNSLLLISWCTMMTADIALAQASVMYLYHYFMPLVLGWVMGASIVRRTIGTASGRLARPALLLAAAAIMLGFLLLAPLAFHRPSGFQGCAERSWGLGLHCGR